MISWRLARFDDLSPREVHDIYRARIEVFVVEQNCVFQDLDGLDPECWHLLGFAPSSRPSPQGEKEDFSLPLGRPQAEGRQGEGRGEGQLVAYCRLVPPGIKFAEPSIGRVLTVGTARRSGVGRELMGRAMEHAESLWPGSALRIGAQRYLEHFYGEFGFVTASEPYDEDGIAHVEMVRAAAVTAGTTGQTVGQ